MQLIESPTERTTAATDAVLAAEGVLGVVYLLRFVEVDPWKTGVWIWILALFAVGAFLGAVVHGLDLAPRIRTLLWQPLFLSLGLAVALFVVAAVTDWRGVEAARRILLPMIGVAVGFYGITRLAKGAFLAFVVYEAAAMVFSLWIYFALSRGGMPGAPMIAAGIVLNIVAAVIQATPRVSLTLIWPFDHNGVFHLVQVVAIAVLVLGVQKSLTATG